MVRAPASYQFSPGSNSGVDAICGLNLLLVLSFALRGFSVFRFSPLLKNQHFQIPIRSGRTDTFQRVPKNSYVFRGKTNYNNYNNL